MGNENTPNDFQDMFLTSRKSVDVPANKSSAPSTGDSPAFARTFSQQGGLEAGARLPFEGNRVEGSASVEDREPPVETNSLAYLLASPDGSINSDTMGGGVEGELLESTVPQDHVVFTFGEADMDISDSLDAFQDESSLGISPAGQDGAVTDSHLTDPDTSLDMSYDDSSISIVSRAPAVADGNGRDGGVTGECELHLTDGETDMETSFESTEGTAPAGIEPETKAQISREPLSLLADELETSIIQRMTAPSPEAAEDLIRAVMVNDMEEVTSLLDQGADIDYVNEFGDSSLIWSCQSGLDNISRTLIARGANQHHANKAGDTPLMWSCFSGSMNIISLLVEQGGVDVNHPNAVGSTPIFLAAKEGHKEVVTYLVEHGANVNHVNFRLEIRVCYGRRAATTAALYSIL